MNSVKKRDILCVAMAFVSMLCLGLGYGWSAYKIAISELYPSWTKANLSLVFSLLVIFFGGGSFLGGLTRRKVSLKAALSLGIVLFVLGFFGISLMPANNAKAALTVICLCYGVLGGLGIGMTYNSINNAIPRFYPKRKGVLSGVTMAGYGSGALIFGSLASKMIRSPSMGIAATFRILALAIGALLFITAALLSKKDEQAQSQKTTGNKAQLTGYSPAEVLLLRSFWRLQIRNVLVHAVCLTIIDRAGEIANGFAIPATLGLIVSVANGLIRIPSGISSDKIGCVKTLQVGNVMLLLSVGVLTAALLVGSVPVLIASFVFFGISYGMTPPVSVNLNAEFFGEKYREMNFAYFSIALAPASLIGPTFVSSLEDAFPGAKGIMLIVIGTYAIVSFVLSLLLQAPPQKQ